MDVLDQAPAVTADARAEIADLFHLLGDPTRLGIVYVCRTTPCSAGAIADAMGISAQLASHHLRLLKAARIVRAERRGRHIYYVAADAHIRRILIDMAEHASEPTS